MPKKTKTKTKPIKAPAVSDEPPAPSVADVAAEYAQRNNSRRVKRTTSFRIFEDQNDDIKMLIDSPLYRGRILASDWMREAIEERIEKDQKLLSDKLLQLQQEEAARKALSNLKGSAARSKTQAA